MGADEQREHVLIVTLNRPEARNALSGEMLSIMVEAWDRVDSDPDIRVCVLTGAGGYFCAGMDLKAAVMETVKRCEGAYGIVVCHADCPDYMVVARKESPLTIGITRMVSPRRC
jgi:enoyl-CoA hydratase/carnithine racemase